MASNYCPLQGHGPSLAGEIPGLKKEKVTCGWRKCYNQVLLEFYSLGYSVKMGRTLGACEGVEKCIQCLA